MLIRCMIKSVHPNKRFTLFQLSCACTCGGCITKVHHMKFREAVSIPGHVSVHWEMRNSSSREQLLKRLNMTAQIWRLWLAYEWKWFWYLIRGNQSHIHWALAGVGPSDAFHMFDHNGMWGVFDQSQKVKSNVTVSIMSCVGGNVCGRSWAMCITRPGNILWSDEGWISIIIFILHIKAFLKLFFLLFHSHVTFISWNYSFKAAVFSLHGCKLHKGKLTTPSSEENWEKSSSSFFAFYACYMYKQSDE